MYFFWCETYLHIVIMIISVMMMMIIFILFLFFIVKFFIHCDTPIYFEPDVADDHTRVVLHDAEVAHDDYINANYIDVRYLYSAQ